MPGTSQGSAYPEYPSTHSLPLGIGVLRDSIPAVGISVTPPDIGDSWQQAVAVAVARVADIDKLTTDLNAASEQRGRSWSLPVPAAEQARIPVWTSRQEWLRQFRHHTTTAAGRALCARRLISPEKAYAVAEAHAHFAESRTGRSVTAAKSTIAARAKVSESTVNRARRVLIALEMGVEHVRGRNLKTLEFLAAEAHHGGQQHRAASTWSLSSPRQIVELTPAAPSRRSRASRAMERSTRSRKGSQPVSRFLSKPRRTSIPADTLSSVGFLSCEVLPSGRTHQRAHACTPQPTNDKHPRPLAVQRVAAELIRHAPALMPPGHIGAVCDVLMKCDIDPTRWSGLDIARTLSRDTAERGWIWPTSSTLTSPIAYLRYRLRLVDWTAKSPDEQRNEADFARLRAQERRRTDQDHRTSNAASHSQRERAMARIRDHLSSTSRKNR
ncbi:hypothetical protein ABH922_005370 [Rhodococcus sp. 27YEA15]